MPSIVKRFLPICLLVTVLALAPRPAPLHAQGIFLPDGFVQSAIAAGFSLPTDFAFAPDGRIFVAEKAGRIRVVQNGSVLGAPLLDISSRVNSMFDRGLLGMTLHPDFPSTPYLYVAYTYEPPEASGYSQEGSRTARISRFTVSGNSAKPSSELVLVGAGGTFDTIGSPDMHDTRPWSCEADDRTPYPDCMPADGMAHTIGMVAFGPDGALYAANGDGVVDFSGSMRAQTYESLAGKILRIDPGTGNGYTNNPFFDGDVTSNRAKVFVYGMRNPFRFDFHPETGKLFVADVGNNKWEEITIAEPGDNLGWPCYEGPEQTGISPTCGGLYTGKEHRRPTYAYPHADGRGAAIGGAFYTGDNFPARYRNAFFYGDFNASTIDVLTFADDGTPVSTPFATNAVAPVRMATGPDGALYVLFIADGTLRRIRYTGGGGDDGAPSVALAAPLPAGTPPIVTIDTPADGAAIAIGATVAMAGSAVEEDGTPVPDAQLRWEGLLRHKEHIHYDYLRATGPTAELVYEDHGDETWLEVCLIAEGSGGEGRACIELFPSADIPSETGAEATDTVGESAGAVAAAEPEVPAGSSENADDATPVDTSEASGIQQGIRREVWSNIGGDAIADLTSLAAYPSSPDMVEILTALEVSGPLADDYGERLSGYLVPPRSGIYTFWIAADDQGELWLSVDDAPERARLIATAPKWTGQRQWDKYPEQQSVPIRLNAGERYYVEVLHKEAGQKDNVAVAWEGPGLERQVIAERYLAPE